MGSGRDKRKKAKPKAPGAGAEKTTRKTEHNESKAVKRAAKAAKVNLQLVYLAVVPNSRKSVLIVWSVSMLACAEDLGISLQGTQASYEQGHRE